MFWVFYWGSLVLCLMAAIQIFPAITYHYQREYKPKDQLVKVPFPLWIKNSYAGPSIGTILLFAMIPGINVLIAGAYILHLVLYLTGIIKEDTKYDPI